MGTVLLRSLRAVYPAARLIVCDRDPVRLRRLRVFKDVQLTRESRELDRVKVVVLAVKPQDFPSAKFSLRKDTLVISIMAGVSIRRLRTKTGAKKIIRAMPNTAAKFGKGFTAWTVTKSVSRSERQFAARLFRHMGDELEVPDEEKIDKATAVTGSGPAYLFYTLQCFTEAARRIGFSRDAALRMVRQTFNGAHALLRDESDLEKLIRQIASKGGTTEVALRTFKDGNLRALWAAAIRNAFRRAKRLSQLR